MRSVSRWVPYVIAVFGAITLLGLLALGIFSAKIFNALPEQGVYSSTVWLTATAYTRHTAIAALEGARARALALLARRGFSGAGMELQPMTVERNDDTHLRTFGADQQIEMRSKSYVDLARLSNAIAQQHDPAVTATSPSATFFPLAVAISICYLLVLLIAAAALETREADVTRAPRGMHPFFVAAQTLLYGLLVALAVLYAHLLVAQARTAFVIVSLLGIALLCVWLWKSRPWWSQSRFMRISWGVYASALVFVVLSGILALAQPIT